MGKENNDGLLQKVEKVGKVFKKPALPIIKEVLKIMFGGKAVLYRIFKISFTAVVCFFYTGSLIKSIDITITIAIGMLLFYGVWEFWNRERNGGDKWWRGFGLFFWDIVVLVGMFIIEVALLYGIVSQLLL